MKHIITLIASLLIIISCVTTIPTWSNIGRDGVYVTVCNDTISTEILKNHHNNYRNWPMSVYTSNIDTITQYTYIKGDSIFSVTFNTMQKDSCVYNVRCFNETVKDTK